MPFRIDRNQEKINKNVFGIILYSNRNGALYIGITNNILRRIYEHKQKSSQKRFRAKYDVIKIVYI
ncbi:GIY-YIG nuclease family protein [Rickettsia oklahomensis]|uniref:GIY-YIG nuclease family protein n=1 Tax=Rickettsia oklahomensis TaxID=3141789 RepID=A0AAU7C0G4_9RICK